MPLTLTEDVESREQKMGRGPDGELRLERLVLHMTLQGTSGHDTALSTVESSTAETYDDLERAGIDLRPVWVDSVAGDGIWEVQVEYLIPEENPPETGESNFSFDTAGGTQHISQSIETTAMAGCKGPGGIQPSFKGAINASAERVEGCDIVVPRYAWSETHYLPDATVTPEYKGKLFALTGKVNNTVFKGCAAGECLFLGASGSHRKGGDWEITFKFGASPNVADFCAGWPEDIKPDVEVPKKGWEYAWVLYRAIDDTGEAGSGLLLQRPAAVYVERVYQEGDFSDLGIGT